ncbi:MAG: sodium/solute symporter [Pirellulales bacterium]
MKSEITTLDFAIIVVYLAGMLGIGIYYAFRTSDSDDFLLGGRRMPSWSIGLSLFATILSTISFLAWPGEIISHGPAILCQVLAYPISFVIVGWLLIPLIMRQPVTSAYEILETRLGPSVRYLASTIFLVLRLLWMSVIMYATAEKILIPILHLPASASAWICLLLGGITVVYSALGGLRAVVTTDVIQAIVLLSAAVATLVLISYWLGGAGAWWPDTWPKHWSAPRVWFHASDRSVLGFMLSMVTWYVAMAGSDQMAIQRYLATRDAKSARRALGFAWTVEACAFVLMAMIGLALLAWFSTHPDWLGPGESIDATPDRLFPRFIVDGLPMGVTGLVIAGLMAAAMSSLSSGINSSAAVIVADFIEGAWGFALSSRGRLLAARVTSGVVGALVVLLSMAVRLIDANLYELTVRVANLMTAPLFVVFCVAFFVPRATALVAWIAAIASTAVAVTISFFPAYHGLGFLWITPGALAGGLLAAMIAAALLGAPAVAVKNAFES